MNLNHFHCIEVAAMPTQLNVIETCVKHVYFRENNVTFQDIPPLTALADFHLHIK